MSQQDFRDQEPAWVKYAQYIGNGSDKFYEVTIHLGDEGLFWLQKRWGARPDAGGGQIKVESYASLQGAINGANDIFSAKINKGYRLVIRPKSADSQVAHERGKDYWTEEEAF
jgi:predicted DNA-binding WGR domain protein